MNLKPLFQAQVWLLLAVLVGSFCRWLAVPSIADAAGPLWVLMLVVLVTNLPVFSPVSKALINSVLTLLGLGICLYSVTSSQPSELAKIGFWLQVLAVGFSIWHSMSLLASVTFGTGLRPVEQRLQQTINLVIPAILGVWIVALWQLVTVGFAIPHVLLPAPSTVGYALVSSLPTLAADFHQTVIKAVIPGFLLGNLVGFLVAILADRIPFLRRGLLPVGNLVSAIPIVGIAPIMVMWFGFDWQSKVAVVVIMTFFPMLVNTISGLAQADAMERDLMRSYGATYWQGLVKMRLPNALPFVFNALKINSTLALIGAIVAEFFGTPIVGMGFRISTEVGRMNLEMVWASIVVAALAGSAFYGLLALLERRVTFWHASFRKVTN
jgi:NitT/TauT family transport system permease protein